MPTNQDETLLERYQREEEVNKRLEQDAKDQELLELAAKAAEVVALAKHHCFGCDAKGDHWHFDDAGIEAFFYAAQKLALEGVGIQATVGATYPELMEYVQAELEYIRNRSK